MVLRSEHPSGPAVDCDVLACDNESVGHQKSKSEVEVLTEDEVLEARCKVEVDEAAQKLHAHHPSLSLSDGWHVV